MPPGEEKTGVFTGFYAVNPVNDARIPIWVADYVLMDYGTGAIMAVPAHDERDFAFARNFDLPIVQVVAPADGEVEEGTAYVAHSDNEVLVNSGAYTGLSSPEAKKAIVAALTERGLGHAAVNYRLRDWLLSRQRYWGCPIPMIHCGACGIVPVPEADLPVLLPEVADYLPKGRSPLAAAEDWVNVTCPSCGGQAMRETDTMDTFVDSSWYFLRYTTPHDSAGPFERDIVDYWLPVNQYIGGIEHAILHLMYARFFTKALHDMDLLGFDEPFARLFNQGMIYRFGSQDVEVEGERRLARRARRPLRRGFAAPLHPLHGAGGSGQGVAGQGRRGDVAFPDPALACRRGGHGARGTGRGARHASHTEGARDDPQGDRRHRAAVRVQHAGCGGDGARERDLRGPGRPRRTVCGRDRGVADPAVRAARGRGAVGTARAFAACGPSRGRSPTSRCSSATRSSSSAR